MTCFSRFIRAGRLSLAGLAVLAAAQPAWAQKVMTPGGWEMTSSITRELPGQPVEQMGRQTLKLCLTPEFLAAEPYLNPHLDQARMAARQAQCTSSDYQREGDAASWTMACDLADGSSLKARLHNRASADRLTLLMAQDIERPGGSKGRVTMSGEGRYAGKCTDEMSKPTPPASAKP